MLTNYSKMLTLPANKLRFSYYTPPRNNQRQIPAILGTRYQVEPNLKVDKISLNVENKIQRIKSQLLGKVELSVSSYDTAWVAMVASKESEEKPLFPESLEWVLENQQPDGSWSSHPWHPLLVKDSLSCTLASVLALTKWDVGLPLVHRGVEFIASNFWAATDEHQVKPIGFDIIFPKMIERATERGLKLPLDPAVLDVLLRNRDNEIRRLDAKGIKAAYLLEGFSEEYEWEQIIKYQASNGSFFNSPSATAAALFRNHNDGCYNYLTSLLKKYDNAVPTIYPMETYIQLCMIDNLQKLGIDRYCRIEIERTLDEIYRKWLQKDEEILMDVNCCAMGFRLLRMNGYVVSSDMLEEFSEEERFFNSVSPPFKNTNTILELFKASQVMIYQKEPVLEKLEAWTSSFLKEQISNEVIQDQKMREEVQHFLRNSYSILDFLESRRTIEQHNLDAIPLLKTSYRNLSDNSRCLLSVATQDFNRCQQIFRQELEYLERKHKNNKLDQLKFARQRVNYCYFSSASILVAPELAEARLCMAENAALATVVDDFFDVGGSKEELENLILLFERWEESSSVGYVSEQVEIIFSALQNSIKELTHIAFKCQGRNVEPYLVKQWYELFKSMMQEAEWAREHSIPTLDEYIEQGYVSFALGPLVLAAPYFLGTRLPEEVMSSPEVHDLFKITSLIGRLLNDIASLKRETEQEGKFNMVSLRIVYGEGKITVEDAIKETKREIEKYRRELLRIVVQKENSSLPKSFRDYFWKFSNMLHYFFKDNDGFTCPLEKLKDLNSFLWEPILEVFEH